MRHPSSYSRSVDEPASDQPLSRAIFRVARAHKTLAARLLRGAGLRPGQELVLMTLWDDGPQRQVDLVERLESDAGTMTRSLARLEKLLEPQAVSQEEVDRARAERDVAKAEIARIRAIIERKTIRAPFRALITWFTRSRCRWTRARPREVAMPSESISRTSSYSSSERSRYCHARRNTE